MSLRDSMKDTDDALDSEDLVISSENSKDNENSNCPICGKVTKMSTCYSWFILNDEDYPDVLEMLFCSKECWMKYLDKERKRLE